MIETGIILNGKEIMSLIFGPSCLTTIIGVFYFQRFFPCASSSYHKIEDLAGY